MICDGADGAAGAVGLQRVAVVDPAGELARRHPGPPPVALTQQRAGRPRARRRRRRAPRGPRSPTRRSSRPASPPRGSLQFNQLPQGVRRRLVTLGQTPGSLFYREPLDTPANTTGSSLVMALFLGSLIACATLCLSGGNPTLVARAPIALVPALFLAMRVFELRRNPRPMDDCRCVLAGYGFTLAGGTPVLLAALEPDRGGQDPAPGTLQTRFTCACPGVDGVSDPVSERLGVDPEVQREEPHRAREQFRADAPAGERFLDACASIRRPGRASNHGPVR